MAQDQTALKRKSNCIYVNQNQSGNKLLKFMKNSWEFSNDISPAHYVMAKSTCALFLSLKYHIIYPNYIYDQLNQLGNNYQLKILIILMDHIEYLSSLKELTKVAIRANCTMMLAWTYEEAAHYINNYKTFAEKSPDIIMGKQTGGNTDNEIYQSLVEALCAIKSVNKTDAVSLISLFDSFENIVKTNQMAICPGMGLQKV